MTRSSVDPASCFTDGSHRFWYNNNIVGQIYRVADCPGMFALHETSDERELVKMWDHYPTVDENVKAWEAWIYG